MVPSRNASNKAFAKFKSFLVCDCCRVECFSNATAKVSELTLEITNLKQREIDIKQKFRDVYSKEKERADEAEAKVQGKN